MHHIAPDNIDNENDDTVELRRRHNDLAPISRLPFSVLTSIFLFFPAADLESVLYEPDEYGDILPDDEAYPTWLSITHVCHLWREAALDCALLWTDIMFYRGPEWRHISFERSKSAPLTIALHSDFDDDVGDVFYEERLEAVLPHLNHIKTLEIDLISFIFTELVSSIHRIPQLPMLEYLWLEDLSEGTCQIPDDLFSGRCPQLRVLKLYDCTFPWTSRMFRLDLITLVLEVDLNVASRPTPDELFTILRQLPSLESLDLSFTFPEERHHDIVYNDWTTSSVHHNPVNMPNLLYLRSSDAPLPLAKLMESLVLPAETKVELECYWHSGDSYPDEVDTLLQVISTRHDQVASSDDDTHLAISWKTDVRDLLVNTSICRAGVDDPYNNLQLRINFSSHVSTHQRAWNFSLVHSLKVFRLETFTAVSLTGDRTIHPSDANAIFSTMQRIRYLNLVGKIAHTFVEAWHDHLQSLHTPSTDENQSMYSPRSTALPALVILRIFLPPAPFIELHSSLLITLFGKRSDLFPDLDPVEIFFLDTSLMDDEIREIEAAKGVRCVTSEFTSGFRR
ncbi:uncharacterized protein STEHIDRAFT_166673 [Stereum hirsutum FP-91666 SS1]|uniref:uncharacterized protein n=1 Tax=Stereum hirsutum (strain FP-91666) TaxID=721885 RepID=UPI000440D0CD|nr:uncharacterized protein STEHIDRAFT_166673 [Stereum hirsutum FP-91666 SS1]EIM90514.1 hypothetical protein STEHIDRAFT_166673 [Stereum hirsutum FP-91666 SS1]